MTGKATDPVNDGIIEADIKVADAFSEALAGRSSQPQTADEKSHEILGQLMRDALLKKEEAGAPAPDPDSAASEARVKKIMQRLEEKGAFKGP